MKETEYGVDRYSSFQACHLAALDHFSGFCSGKVDSAERAAVSLSSVTSSSLSALSSGWILIVRSRKHNLCKNRVERTPEKWTPTANAASPNNVCQSPPPPLLCLLRDSAGGCCGRTGVGDRLCCCGMTAFVPPPSDRPGPWLDAASPPSLWGEMQRTCVTRIPPDIAFVIAYMQLYGRCDGPKCSHG